MLCIVLPCVAGPPVYELAFIECRQGPEPPLPEPPLCPAAAVALEDWPFVCSPGKGDGDVPHMTRNLSEDHARTVNNNRLAPLGDHFSVLTVRRTDD